MKNLVTLAVLFTLLIVVHSQGIYYQYSNINQTMKQDESINLLIL